MTTSLPSTYTQEDRVPFLPDVDALVRWLVESGVLTLQKGKALAKKMEGHASSNRLLALLFNETRDRPKEGTQSNPIAALQNPTLAQ